MCYPAHIDRDSNSMIAVLGTIPPDSPFSFYELHNSEKIKEYCDRYALTEDRIIISSDAHNLEAIRDKENYFELDADISDPDLVRQKLFEYLRGKL